MNLTKSFFSKRLWTTLSLMLFSTLIMAQTRGLSLEKIMSGNEFIGHQPSNFQWAANGQEIFFRWNKDKELIAPWYVYSRRQGTYKQLKPEETHSFEVNGFQGDPLLESVYFKKGNNLYKQAADFSEKRIVFSSFQNFELKRILANGSVILKMGDNLFHFNESPAKMTQLTNFVNGKNTVERGDRSFLEDQQRELFDIVRLNDARDSARDSFNEQHQAKTLTPFYKDEKNIGWTEISNDIRYCAFRMDEYPENKPTHIESYLTENGYSQKQNARSKVGKQNPTHDFLIWDLKEDTTFKIDLSSLTGIKKQPEFLGEYQEDLSEELKEAKDVIILPHGFNDACSKYLIEIKSYDNKDRWIAYVDLENMKLYEIDHQHDEAWIGGPGISGWNMVPGNVNWVDNQLLYFQSEESGYSHLYKYDMSKYKNQKTTMTSGNWEVHDAILSHDKNKLFITTNKTHPGNRDFHVLEIKSGKLTPVLTQDGNHEVSISPNEKWLAVRYSYKNKPWELYIAPLEENAKMTQITDSRSEEFKSYPWRDVEVITFKAKDGADVPARIYRPTTDKKNGAAVIFVHGAGYLQNAHNWWSGYYREYMFNNLLCDLGYTVLDIDYRASKGYGRDWRTAIYQHMGGADLSDHMDGREFLIEQEGIDEERIGIYGGSYGGFITLMALLTEPGKFKCGAALRSVTDWAHYNHEYTSNILNTPEEDPKAFKRSSPIYFAENLEDKLVMLHGIEDDNVQYQDVVRLSQRFIELGKKNWDLVGFPIEPHGFKETSSWVEEYRRILELFESELK